jgi:hypothetical protein
LVADILPLVQGSGNWSRLRQHLPLSAPRKGTKPVDSNLSILVFNNQNKRVPAKVNTRNVSDNVFFKFFIRLECVGHSSGLASHPSSLATHPFS